MPEIPPSLCPRFVPLTLWMVTFEDGQIICRPHAVTGPFRLFTSSRHEVPPEWLARAIPLADDLEAQPWR